MRYTDLAKSMLAPSFCAPDKKKSIGPDNILATSAMKDQLTQDLKGKPISPWVKVIAGMAGGVAEATCLQPLDVAKTRLQLDRSGKYGGLLNCGRTIIREEGYLSLYKGLTPFVSQLTLKYALRFGSFGFFRETLLGGTPWSDPTRNFVAGLLAGVTESVLIVTPFEVVKTRMQKETGVGRFSGPIDCARQVVQREGVSALWKGNLPTMVRQGSNQAFNFMCFSLLNKHMWHRDTSPGAVNPPLESWKVFINGIVAGSVGPCFNCPMDVAKTRLMAQETVPGVTPKYNGFFQTFQVIAREEGVRALWKGLVPRLMRLAPGQGITWMVVTKVTHFMEERAEREHEHEMALRSK